MAKKLDPKLIEIFKQYDMEAKECLWDCHGNWIAYHKAIEEIAAKAGVKFERPEILEHNSEKGYVALICYGKLNDREEWSVGECSPKNNKNAYPYAMAEKRAKDRVILKLVGLHGLAYSEEEADDFKPAKTAAEQKRRWDRIKGEIENDTLDINSKVALRTYYKERWDEMKQHGLGSEDWKQCLDAAFEPAKKRIEKSEKSPADRVKDSLEENGMEVEGEYGRELMA